MLCFVQEIIDNKPCLKPSEMSEDQLSLELKERGKNSSRSREEMADRLLKLDQGDQLLKLI